MQEAPGDFTLWTTLITTAERLDDLEKLRTVFEEFLKLYPLCYGYWKKYADAEHRHGDMQRASNVFERGVAATPYSCDLWCHFATYKKTSGASAEDVRRYA